MTLGDTLSCTIESLAYGGDGLARVDGRVVFIGETIPGETVRCRVTAVKKNYARAELLKVEVPSPDRIEPCCRVSDPADGTVRRVPGCVYDHLGYPAELAAKQHQLQGFLRRLKDAQEPHVLPALAAPHPLHYRNKIVLHSQRGRVGTALGYRLEPSHRVLDIPACPLACEAINRALGELRASPAFRALPPDVDVTLRWTPHDGALWWTSPPSRTQAGPDLLTENSPAGPLAVPRDGFYQVNPSVADELVRTAAAWFADDAGASDLLDLYCGVGVFGFACMRAGGTRLTGIEAGRAAIAAARQNARALGIPATFLCNALGQSALEVRKHLAEPARATIIVDPPRDGLDPDITRALVAAAAKRIFYVSCDPATLTRDLAVLTSGGYRLTRARLFDLFPRTAHFETLAELTHG